MKRSRQVRHVSELFAHYKERLQAPPKVIVATFVEEASSVCGVALSAQGVAYSPHNKTISLSLSGAVRTEVLLHKEEVLRRVRERVGAASAPVEIR